MASAIPTYPILAQCFSPGAFLGLGNSIGGKRNNNINLNVMFFKLKGCRNG